MEIRRIVSQKSNTEIIFNEDSGISDISVGYLTRKKSNLDLGVPLKIVNLKNIPTPAIESHVLEEGFSHVRIPFHIFGGGDTPAAQQADMERRWHDITERLEETALFFDSRGLRGSRAEFQYKEEGAEEISFKTIYFGWVDEKGARGDKDGVECAQLKNMELHLICESHWRPSTFNHLFNGGFEFWDRVQYGGTGADTEPDGWDDFEDLDGGTGTNNQESTPADVQQGDHALRIEVSNLPNTKYKGVHQSIFGRVIPGVQYTLIVWVKNDAITNGEIRVQVLGTPFWLAAPAIAAVNTVYTRYTVAFTPKGVDTAITVRAFIYSNPGVCSGTAYIDGMMVVRGTVVPDDFIEWHPNPGIRIGPNVVLNAGFEEWHAGTANAEPDCWSDFEQLTDVATGTNNREATNVLQGCYALKVDVDTLSLNDYKGVRQDIRLRVVNDTEYVLIVWVKNAAMGPNCTVRVRVDGLAAGLRWALNSGNANSAYTRYAVTFTPRAGDGNVWIALFINGNIAGGSGTAYFDKLMVIEAQVYNGHSFAPEEWTGCGYVWNHYDGPCGESPPATNCGHVNYMNITDLLGDVDCRLRIEMESLFDDDFPNTFGMTKLTVGRRTAPCLPCKFVHFLEGEDFSDIGDWAPHADNERSDCEVISRTGVPATGYVIWDLVALGYDAACQQGRFRALAAVWSDHAFTKFRATTGIEADRQIGSWVDILQVDTWHWLDLGVFDITGRFWGNELPSSLYWKIEYGKDVAATVELDFLLLMPEDESVLRVLLKYPGLLENYDAVWDNTFDFILAMKRNTADAFMQHPAVQAEPLALKPVEENRLIFAIGNYISSLCYYDGCYAHETGDCHILVSLKYLPQFVSPLE